MTRIFLEKIGLPKGEVRRIDIFKLAIAWSALIAILVFVTWAAAKDAGQRGGLGKMKLKNSDKHSTGTSNNT